MSLWEYIKENLHRSMSQTIEEDGAKMTYEELLIFAESFSENIKYEKCCAIYCKSEMATAMALLGCFAAGVTAVPLSWRYGDVHCKKILDLISPTCIITDFKGGLRAYRIIDSKYDCPPTNPALIMCTSGTTGVPKGAMLSEKNIITNVEDIVSYFNIDKTDTILISRPMYHCAVLTGEFLTSIVKGTKIVFSSGNFNPVNIIDLWKKHRITVFCGTPTLLRLLSRFCSKTEDICLKHIVISGECMDASVGSDIEKAFPGSKIYHVYGLTEACPRVSYMPPEFFSNDPGAVGRPLHSVDIKIIDNITNDIVKNGERGMLWVKGDNIMLGYYNSPEQTATVLKDGWLCTGDIASIDSYGWLKIHGRYDNLIIRAGMNIYPQEIESEMKKDSRTKEVIVYGKTDEKYGMQVVMEIEGEYASKDEVYELCKKTLPSYQIPTKIYLAKELPKNASGKINRVRNNG